MNLKTYWLGHDKKLHSASIANVGDVMLAINLTASTLKDNNELYQKPILASVPCGKPNITETNDTNDTPPSYA